MENDWLTGQHWKWASDQEALFRHTGKRAVKWCPQDGLVSTASYLVEVSIWVAGRGTKGSRAMLLGYWPGLALQSLWLRTKIECNRLPWKIG